MNRNEIIQYYQANPKVTVLVVGAGINGIGTFRDLALQGVDVLLVERGDYCSGASAASSHMVHGGIRYLENGEFRLVREAVGERNRMIENIPHLVKPLPTVFPIFKWFSGLLNAPLKFFGLLERPSERGAVVIKIGMTLYDLFTRAQKTVPPHRFDNRKQALRRFPRLNPQIIFTGTYYDGAMPSPERISIELLMDTLRSSNTARAANYVSLAGLEGDEVWLRDEVSGERFSVQPDLLINATGPWIDLTNRLMGLETQFIGGTKGSHLILDNPELRDAIHGHEFFFENQDGRIVLIFPLEDKVMVGTSDIRIDDPDQARCTEEEIEYFFGMVGRVFPEIKLARSQIVFQFSGVRPLPYTAEGATGQISRDHKVEVIPAGQAASFPVLSLVGGKWTSFRAFSEHTADIALAQLGRSRVVDTKSLAVGGSRGYPRTEQARTAYLEGLVARCAASPELLERTFDRYGTAIEAMLCTPNPVAEEIPWSLPDYHPEEIAWLVKHEDVVHLDDLILRRTMLAKLGLLTSQGLTDLARLAARVKGWSKTEERQEIKRTRNLLAERHGVKV